MSSSNSIPRWKQKHVTRARRLRREMTDAERRIWRHLRQKQLGVRFRRQNPVGRYIVDFVCLEYSLAIELDGGQHDELRAGYDRARTLWLESQGFRVLRVWNSDALSNTDGVLTEIELALNHARFAGAPHPGPPPHAGEGD